MRQILFSIYLAGLFVGLSSCCTKKDCDGFDSLNEIQLLNFSASEVDSIALEIFESNSNFTNRIDSSFTSAHDRSGGVTEFIIFMNENINKSHAYKITLISTGQVYKVTSFETSGETCNSCFPYHPSSDYFNVLNSYSINGQKQNNSSLTISK